MTAPARAIPCSIPQTLRPSRPMRPRPGTAEASSTTRLSLPASGKLSSMTRTQVRQYQPTASTTRLRRRWQGRALHSPRSTWPVAALRCSTPGRPTAGARPATSPLLAVTGTAPSRARSWHLRSTCGRLRALWSATIRPLLVMRLPTRAFPIPTATEWMTSTKCTTASTRCWARLLRRPTRPTGAWRSLKAR